MALATTANRNYPIVDNDPSSYMDTVIIPALASLANLLDVDVQALITGKIPTTALDTDGTLAANSDTKIASQKATKTYVGTVAATKQDYAARLAAIVATGITASMFATNVFDTDATLSANDNTRIASQSAVKSYVDNAITGVFWKPAVDVATTANVTLSGEQTIDGVLTSASRVLVKNQSTATQNGIYLTAAGSWTRVSDADTGFELWGSTVMVKRGTTQANTQWTNTNTTQPTVGSTNITYAQISGAGTYSATGGVVLTGNQFSADTGTSGHKLPWLDGVNTWGATQTLPGLSMTGAIAISYTNPDTSGISLTASTGTNAAGMKFVNAGGNYYVGPDNSAGARLQGAGNTEAYAFVINAESARAIRFATNNVNRMGIASDGLVSFYLTGTEIGARTYIKGNNEIYALGISYASGLNAMFIGATNSATPDMVFSNSGGTELGRFKYAGGLGIGASNATQNLIAIRQNGINLGALLTGVMQSRANGAHSWGLDTTSGAHVNFYTDNGSFVLAGNISSSGGSTSYNATSDRVLKRHIVDAGYDPEWILRHRVREFEFKAFPGEKLVGFIAQELERSEPAAFTPRKGKPGSKSFQPASVDNSKLIPKMILEMQAMRRELNELRKAA